MAKPCVGVIIPAHNAQRTLKATLDSVLAQTYRPIRVVVVADRCSDNTISIAEGLGINVMAVDFGSAAKSRNAGIHALCQQGPKEIPQWLAFLDDDDLWHRHWLEKAMAVAAGTDAHLLYGRAKQLYPSGAIDHGHDLPAGGDLFETLLQSCFLTTSAVIVKRDAAYEAGLFDERFLGAGVEDYDLWLRIAAGGALAEVPGEWVTYRRRGRSATHDPRGFEELLKKTLEVLDKAMTIREPTPAVKRAALGNAYRMSAERHLANGIWRRGMKDLWRAVRERPVDLRYLKLMLAAGIPPPMVRYWRNLR